MTTTKKHRGFRLSDRAFADLYWLADLWGVSDTAVVEVAVRMLRRWAEGAGPAVEPPPAGEGREAKRRGRPGRRPKAGEG
jgi:hypothetical protein